MLRTASPDASCSKETFFPGTMCCLAPLRQQPSGWIDDSPGHGERLISVSSCDAPCTSEASLETPASPLGSAILGQTTRGSRVDQVARATQGLAGPAAFRFYQGPLFRKTVKQCLLNS